MDGAAVVELLYKLAYESWIDLLTPPKKNAKNLIAKNKRLALPAKLSFLEFKILVSH